MKKPGTDGNDKRWKHDKFEWRLHCVCAGGRCRADFGSVGGERHFYISSGSGDDWWSHTRAIMCETLTTWSETGANAKCRIPDTGFVPDKAV